MSKRIGYLKVSPRGFSNETYIVRDTEERLAIAKDVINNDPNAWAVRVPASDLSVRAIRQAIKREARDIYEGSFRATAWTADGKYATTREPAISWHDAMAEAARRSESPDYSVCGFATVGEDMLRDHRPTYLHDDGSRSLGGSRLPEATDAS